MKLIRFFILLFMIPVAWSADVKPQNIEPKIIEKIAKTDPICSTCKFIIQKKKYDWIKNHEVYEITTVDILPSPAWHIAVRNDKELVFLNHRKRENWNDMMHH